MPILKFWIQNTNVSLDNFRLEDITTDKRTSLINKCSLIKDEFKIDKNVYMAISDLFFKMSKIFNKEKTPISAMLIRDDENIIIIVPSKNYIFLNGKSVEPIEYKIFHQETSVYKQLLSVR